MAFLEVLAQLIHPKSSEQPSLKRTRKPGAPPAILDCRPQEDTSDITDGVKYSSKYGWQISPPLGWRRQESYSSLNWPHCDSSPTVTFINSNVKPPEQALLRWTLLGQPETPSSHEQLERLLASKVDSLTIDSMKGLEAPGLVAGMKVHKVKLQELSDRLPVLVVQATLKQCQGEPPILRYVFILPDRCMPATGEVKWYRETLQFTATENSFWASESVAVRSLTSFRRGICYSAPSTVPL